MDERTNGFDSKNANEQVFSSSFSEDQLFKKYCLFDCILNIYFLLISEFGVLNVCSTLDY